MPVCNTHTPLNIIIRVLKVIRFASLSHYYFKNEVRPEKKALFVKLIWLLGLLLDVLSVYKINGLCPENNVFLLLKFF